MIDRLLTSATARRGITTAFVALPLDYPAGRAANEKKAQRFAERWASGLSNLQRDQRSLCKSFRWSCLRSQSC
jgi:hypothetical protein